MHTPLTLTIDADRVQIEVPAAEGTVVLQGTGAETQIKVQSQRLSTWVTEAVRLRTEGHVQQALELVRPHLQVEAEKGEAHSFSARFELALGNVPEAIAHFEHAIEYAKQEGHLSREVDDTLALAYALVERSEQLENAKKRLALLSQADRRLATLYPEGHARLPYYQGLLFLALGQVLEANESLRIAQRMAQNFGLRPLERNARSMLAQVQLRIGIVDEATRVFQGLLADSNSPCEQVAALLNLGHAHMVSGATREALTLFSTASALQCADTHLTSLVWINVAEAQSEQGDSVGAVAALRQVGSPTLKLEERLSLEHAKGLSMVLEGGASAGVALLREAFLQARRAQLFDVGLRVGLGWARVVCIMHANRCIAAHQEVEALLDESVRTLPLTLGQGAFVSMYGESTQTLVAQLPPRQALDVARHARRRSNLALVISAKLLQRPQNEANRVRYHQARLELEKAVEQEWTLPAAVLEATRAKREQQVQALERSLVEGLPPFEGALPALPSKDVLLASSPIAGGHRVFWVQDARVEAWSMQQETLPAPLVQRLKATQKDVRILPSEMLMAQDLERMVSASTGLLYSLDLRGASAPSLIQNALIVGDPLGDLPRSRAEASMVDTLLPQPITRTLLLGAGFSAFMDAAPKVDWLHYAGHSVPAGEAALGASLPLAQGAHVRTSDILALGRVPSVVMLLSCKASAEHGTLGLAQAFIAAGSQAVIAADVALSDVDAEGVSARLYRNLAQVPQPWRLTPTDLSVNLRAALHGAPSNIPLRVYVP